MSEAKLSFVERVKAADSEIAQVLRKYDLHTYCDYNRCVRFVDNKDDDSEEESYVL